MWILQTYSKQKFYLTDKQKDAYLDAINAGKKLMNFGSFVLSDNFEYLASEEELKLQSLKSNPILNDPDYLKYVLEDSLGAINRLNSKYSGIKYEKLWVEANENREYVKSLAVI